MSNETVKEVVAETIERKRIEERIETMEKQREAFLAQANQQIAALNGAIEALKALLEPEKANGKVEPEVTPTTE